MALKDISGNKVKIYNPYGLYVTPYLNENTKGDTTFFLDEVIRDTTTITQEDPTENRIENEFGSAPILNNVQLGSYTFSAEVADMQPELLKALCGYEDGDDHQRIYAPSVYAPVFAEIALVFKSADKYIAAILPKVQLNSKATFDSLSTSMGRITLAGTGLNASVDSKQTPFILDTDYARVGDVNLILSGLTDTGFTVTATPNGFTASTYAWKVNGTTQTDTDNSISYTSAIANTSYTISCTVTADDGKVVTATLKVQTPSA